MLSSSVGSGYMVTGFGCGEVMNTMSAKDGLSKFVVNTENYMRNPPPPPHQEYLPTGSSL